MFSLYAALGLAENSRDQDVDTAYSNLKAKLETVASQFAASDPFIARSAKNILAAIEKAYRTLTNPELKRIYQIQQATLDRADISDTHPRLGQLCVTSGIITMDQLKEAVDAQVRSGAALGEILQDMQFITQAELDGLLLGQQMIDAPSGVLDPVASRLVSLGLITEDMALIAQIEAKSTSASIKNIMRRHSWVPAPILDAVLD